MGLSAAGERSFVRTLIMASGSYDVSRLKFLAVKLFDLVIPQRKACASTVVATVVKNQGCAVEDGGTPSYQRLFGANAVQLKW